MTRRWFTPWGWTYRPTSVPAAVLVALAGVFCLTVVRAIDRHSHSASDTLYGVFPFIVPTLLALDWVASKTSRGRDGG
jgi:hypothetical protein